MFESDQRKELKLKYNKLSSIKDGGSKLKKARTMKDPDHGG